ncbi:hypothetical protein Tfer_0861 [Thermincola ferriacetica]|uniref:Uncharacterized protein n=2 Tax=Thermincola ferriacetica TaxID=281456 RepID=A0A0L6W4A3_9FIRM|nr:hypothetical protein Tfer_0861 [Thermincola ferriacetica]
MAQMLMDAPDELRNFLVSRLIHIVHSTFLNDEEEIIKAKNEMKLKCPILTDDIIDKAVTLNINKHTDPILIVEKWLKGDSQKN